MLDINTQTSRTAGWRRRPAARFPAASRRAGGAGPAGAHRPADRQGHRAASAGALAVPGRPRRGRSAARSCSPMSSTAAAATTTCRSWSARCGLAAHLRGRHGPAGRGDRARLAQRDRASDPAGAWSTRRACQEVVHHGRRPARAGRRARSCCRCRSRRRASTPRRISPPRSASPRIPRPASQNMGTYRGALKATDRLGVRMASRIGGAGGYLHWLKHQKLQARRCRAPS